MRRARVYKPPYYNKCSKQKIPDSFDARHTVSAARQATERNTREREFLLIQIQMFLNCRKVLFFSSFKCSADSTDTFFLIVFQ